MYHPLFNLALLAIVVHSVSAVDVLAKAKRFPPETLDDYWQAYKTRYNKSYAGNVEAARRMSWEANLVTIYKHNLMAAAGHHNYTLRDNHIADLGSRQYIREMPFASRMEGTDGRGSFARPSPYSGQP